MHIAAWAREAAGIVAWSMRSFGCCGIAGYYSLNREASTSEYFQHFFNYNGLLGLFLTILTALLLFIYWKYITKGHLSMTVQLCFQLYTNLTTVGCLPAMIPTGYNIPSIPVDYDSHQTNLIKL
jgi:hypothetical protein